MSRFVSPFLALILWVFLPAEPVLAAGTVLRKAYDQTTHLQVDSVFGPRVKSGQVPYWLTIQNGRSRPITWSIEIDYRNRSSSGRSYKSMHTIRVEPGQKVVQELLVPAPPSERGATGVNISFRIVAPGLDPVSETIRASLDGHWPSLVISKRMALGNVLSLAAEKSSQKKGEEHFAETFEELPTQWQAYTCLDALLIDEDTWRASTRQQQRAAMTWVRFGGLMDLYSTRSDASFESLGLEAPEQRIESTTSNAQKGTYSLGQVEILRWDGKSLPPSQTVSRYGGITSFDSAINADFKSDWNLYQVFGTKDFSPLLVIILLIVFAILVGPVNLFHFAKAGRRHRLFVTTPLISLAASLVIIGIIFLQDGLGGNGRRIALVDVQSNTENRQLQVLQQQVSRTGVMLRSGFDFSERPVLTPVTLADSSWNPLSNRRRQAEITVVGQSYSGDLFRSRSEQGFHLRSIRPSRSRVELRKTGGGDVPPLLFSSLEFVISDFFYVDDSGKVWKSSQATLPPGTEIALEEDSKGHWRSMKEKFDLFALSDRERIEDMKGQPGRYFALCRDPAKVMIETHPAIRWMDDVVIVTGKVVIP